MAVLLLALHAAVLRRTAGAPRRREVRAAALCVAMSALAVAHAAALQRLKDLLAW
jgi:hypothetical protein